MNILLNIFSSVVVIHVLSCYLDRYERSVKCCSIFTLITCIIGVYNQGMCKPHSNLQTSSRRSVYVFSQSSFPSYLLKRFRPTGATYMKVNISVTVRITGICNILQKIKLFIVENIDVCGNDNARWT